MASVRTIVKRRLKELDWTPYELAKRVRGKVSSAAVYDFVNQGREMGTGKLAYLLSALGLEIRPKE